MPSNALIFSCALSTDCQCQRKHGKYYRIIKDKFERNSFELKNAMTPFLSDGKRRERHLPTSIFIYDFRNLFVNRRDVEISTPLFLTLNMEEKWSLGQCSAAWRSLYFSTTKDISNEFGYTLFR